MQLVFDRVMNKKGSINARISTSEFFLVVIYAYRSANLINAHGRDQHEKSGSFEREIAHKCVNCNKNVYILQF